ncbi:MAG: NHL repeat-containing protein [Candidatus Zixiibacteriota bacterium]|nr:MAG: NHL repeat-containing protein [candidate division Zixibacteria bacterium]
MRTKLRLTLLLACLVFVTALAQGQSGQVKFVYGVWGYSDSQPFSSPQGIFYDRWNREIYLCDSGNHQVVIFDSTGFPLYRFTHSLRRSKGEEKILGEPRNLVVNKAGDIFLIDNLVGFVDILDQRGNSVDRLILQDIPELENLKLRPEFLAVDTLDNLYVATRGEGPKILIFDGELNLMNHFGTEGDEEGEFKTITGLWVDDVGKIYVTDADAKFCVQVFTGEGEFLLGFGGHDINREDFSLPTGVVTTADGTIFVADELRQVVKAFDSDGQFLSWFGGFGGGSGAMRYPRYITSDGDQELFVVERVGRRYQKFVLNRE